MSHVDEEAAAEEPDSAHEHDSTYYIRRRRSTDWPINMPAGRKGDVDLEPLGANADFDDVLSSVDL